MQSALEQLRKQLDDLGRQVQELEGRVQGLESTSGALGVVHRTRGPRSLPTASAPATGPGPAGALALVGRTLVVLGGAFLIRATSDREWVEPLVGAGAALLYSAAWMAQTARSAARGQRTSALFHGVTALIIAHPLLWETTLSFQLIGAPLASALALAVLGIGLTAARRSDLHALAWGVVLAHVATCFVLMIGTRDFLHPTLALLGSALAVETLTAGDRWSGLRWPVALGADLAPCLLVSSALFLARQPDAAPAFDGATPMAVLLALPLVYLLSIGAHTLRRTRPISVFEIVQAAAALGVGLGGAARIELVESGSARLVGAIAVALAVVGYGAAFTRLDREPPRGRSFHACATLALLLALSGAPLLLDGARAPLAVAWSALTALAIALGVSTRRGTLAFHGSAYALAGAWASGLLAAASDGLLGGTRAAPPLPALALVNGLVTLGCCAASFARAPAEPAWHGRLPRSLLAALVAFSLAGLLARGLAPPLLARATAHPDAAVAAMRTLVISAFAVLLAFAGRRFDLRELHWLVYPVLAGGAAKILWHDLAAGEPVALFVALGGYGGALIATSRLMLGGERRGVASGAATEERPVGQ